MNGGPAHLARWRSLAQSFEPGMGRAFTRSSLLAGPIRTQAQEALRCSLSLLLSIGG
jgi:hypothetical protein